MLALLPIVQHKQHIIWDWNGTLLNDLEHNVATMNFLLEHEGLPAISEEQHRLHFGFPVKSYYEKLGFDTSSENFARLCTLFNDHYWSQLETCSLVDGAVELLRELSDMGKTQSLLSATEQSRLEQAVGRFGIADLFDHIVGIHDNQASGKLERARELLSRVDLPPENSVMIGDTDHDLEIGNELGIDVILVEHGHQHPERLRAMHHTVIPW
ncbi:MAG TPA: HAD family hydrolase [Candidatus Kapabacteria bacterium]|nr:HAD family hydrolase [Candidatus Kapabacteria bacterium]